MHSKTKQKLLAITHNNLKYLRKTEKDGQEKSYSLIEIECMIFEDVEAFVLIYDKKTINKKGTQLFSLGNDLMHVYLI